METIPPTSPAKRDAGAILPPPVARTCAHFDLEYLPAIRRVKCRQCGRTFGADRSIDILHAHIAYLETLTSDTARAGEAGGRRTNENPAGR